jgi:hypothetical protein
MQLDLSKLYDIKATPPRQKPSRNDTATFRAKVGNCTHSPEKDAKTDKIITNIITRDRADITRARAVYSEYQQNIKHAGELRTDIIKGIKRAEEPADLLLKAIECISLMTGDRALYIQAEQDIKTIYGHILGQPAPLNMELAELDTRIDKIQSCIDNKSLPPGEHQRAQNAIRELIKRRDYILQALAKK